jgi:hypothetical protein
MPWGRIVSEEQASLDELGLRFGTDKSSSLHNYLTFYERYFAPIRHKNLRFLEIGVFRGASLAVWESYFPNAHLVGADIDSAALGLARPRVSIEIVDQSNLECLVGLGMKHGPFDIVIEDGSHFWEHQITSLKTIFPFVRKGGIYIVEDLQTNFGAGVESHRGVASISCVDYLKKLVDLRLADNEHATQIEEDPFLRTYGRGLTSINFYKGLCLIEK